MLLQPFIPILFKLISQRIGISFRIRWNRFWATLLSINLPQVGLIRGVKVGQIGEIEIEDDIFPIPLDIFPIPLRSTQSIVKRVHDWCKRGRVVANLVELCCQIIKQLSVGFAQVPKSVHLQQ